jgi:hypothetical protein
MTDPNAAPSGSNSPGQNASVNFASLLWDPLNGPLAIGLSVAEDKEFDELLKLEIVDPKLVYAKGSGLYLLDEAGDRMQLVCANIALLVAYNVAVKHRIETKPYSSLEAADLHKGVEVAAAFAVTYYGLAGYFATNKDGIPVPKDLLINNDSDFTNYGSTAACGVKLKADAEWVNMARTLFNGTDTTVLKALKTYTAKAVREAVTSLIVATKINWFSTNHHVGQGSVTIFVQKAITVLFRGPLLRPIRRNSPPLSTRSVTGLLHTSSWILCRLKPLKL